MHETDSSHIAKEANIWPRSGLHMKMNIRQKQVNLIPHHQFSAFREDYLAPLEFT